MQTLYDAPSRRLSAEWTVLLQSILGAVHPKSAVADEPFDLPWNRVKEIAENNGVTPWFAEWLGGKGLSWGVSPEFQADVERRAYAYRSSLEVRCRQFEEIAEVFQRQGIAFIPLHAVVMAKRLYPKPYRPVSSFDLFVHDSMYPAAHAALSGMGFRCPRPGHYRKADVLVELAAEWSYEVDGQKLRCEPAAFWDKAYHTEGAQYDLDLEDHAVLSVARAAAPEARLVDWVDLLLCDRAAPSLVQSLMESPLIDATPSERQGLVTFLSDLRGLAAVALEGPVPASCIPSSLSGVLSERRRLELPVSPPAASWLEGLAFSLRRWSLAT